MERSPEAGFGQPEFALLTAGSVHSCIGSGGSRRGPTSTHTFICSLQQLYSSVGWVGPVAQLLLCLHSPDEILIASSEPPGFSPLSQMLSQKEESNCYGIFAILLMLIPSGTCSKRQS